MTLYDRIQGDPELRAKEHRLQRLASRIGWIRYYMEKGTISRRAGDTRLSVLQRQNSEARQGSVYERWSQAYMDAARRARKGRERE